MNNDEIVIKEEAANLIYDIFSTTPELEPLDAELEALKDRAKSLSEKAGIPTTDNIYVFIPETTKFKQICKEGKWTEAVNYVLGMAFFRTAMLAFYDKYKNKDIGLPCGYKLTQISNIDWISDSMMRQSWITLRLFSSENVPDIIIKLEYNPSLEYLKSAPNYLLSPLRVILVETENYTNTGDSLLALQYFNKQFIINQVNKLKRNWE